MPNLWQRLSPFSIKIYLASYYYIANGGGMLSSSVFIYNQLQSNAADFYKPCFLIYAARSRHLAEYPISLSYQATIFTILSSMTMVDRPSTMEECGLPTISDDTSGSSLYCIIPFKSP